MIEKKQYNIQEIKAGTAYIPEKKKDKKFSFRGGFKPKDYTRYNMTITIDFNMYYYRTSAHIEFFLYTPLEQRKYTRMIFSKILSRIKYIKINLKYTTIENSPRIMEFEKYLDLSNFVNIFYDARIADYSIDLFTLKNDVLYDTIPDCDVKNVLVELYIGVID